MKRILLMPSSYPPVLGGVQTAAHALARHLAAQERQVEVLTNHYPRTLRRREVIDGIPVHRALFLQPRLAEWRNGRLDLWLASLYYYPAALLDASQLVDAFQPDVVNVHFPDAQIPIVPWLRRRRTFRLIVSLHGHEILRWLEATGGGSDDSGTGLQRRNSEYRKLTGLLQVAEGVTACSRWLLNKAIELEPSVAAKGHVIANGIDLDRFTDKACFSHARPYILAFGRLTHVKGFDMLLRAFSLVAPDHPGLDLLIAGDGEDRAELGALGERLNLDGRVLFTGRATPAEVVRLLNGCAFVIVPSRSETFGIAALEALAAGKPVLATRVGGLGEFLENGLGSGSGARTQLVEATVGSLAEGIRHWLTPQTALASQRDSHPLDLSRFTWNSVATQYGEVYERA